MAPSTESPKKEENPPTAEEGTEDGTDEAKKDLGGSKCKKVPPPSEIPPEAATGEIEEIQADFMKVIKQRNFIRRLATKIRKTFIPNSLNRYMQLTKVAKTWKAIKFPFNPKRFIGLSKAKKIGRLWKPRKRPSQTIGDLQNVFLIQRMARTWKKDWLKKKWAKLFPKNFIQVVRFKTVVTKWKGTALKRALTKVYRVLAARIRMKKWKKKKKKEPQMSIHSIIYLKTYLNRWRAAQRRIKLPKSLVGFVGFKMKVKRWEKTSTLRRLARIFIPRSLINLLNLKRKAIKWKKHAGIHSGLSQITKIGIGISGMDMEGNKDKSSFESSKAGAGAGSGAGAGTGVGGKTAADGGLDRKQSTMSSSGKGDDKSGLERRESTMSSSGKTSGETDGGLGGKTSEQISETGETGDSVGNLGDSGQVDGRQGTRSSVSGQGAGAGRGSVSQGQGEVLLGKTGAGDVKVKVVKTEKEIRAEKLAKYKTDIQEAENLLEQSKELKVKAEIEIDKIKPFYIAALEDSKLSPKLILWIKSIRFNPPEAIRILMEAVCVLKGIKPYVKYDKTTKTILFVDYWVPSKKLLGGDFAKELKALRKVGNHKMHYLKEFVGYVLPNEDFDRDRIEHAYPPCALLYDWILSIYDFGTISIKYEKKSRKLREAEDMYFKALNVIKRAKHEITKIERAIEREEKYQNKDHYTTKLTLLPSQKSYTFTVTGSSKRRYEYDFVNRKK